jgi:hypothetical protein
LPLEETATPALFPFPIAVSSSWNVPYSRAHRLSLPSIAPPEIARIVVVVTIMGILPSKSTTVQPSPSIEPPPPSLYSGAAPLVPSSRKPPLLKTTTKSRSESPQDVQRSPKNQTSPFLTTTLKQLDISKVLRTEFGQRQDQHRKDQEEVEKLDAYVHSFLSETPHHPKAEPQGLMNQLDISKVLQAAISKYQDEQRKDPRESMPSLRAETPHRPKNEQQCQKLVIDLHSSNPSTVLPLGSVNAKIKAIETPGTAIDPRGGNDGTAGDQARSDEACSGTYFDYPSLFTASMGSFDVPEDFDNADVVQVYKMWTGRVAEIRQPIGPRINGNVAEEKPIISDPITEGDCFFAFDQLHLNYDAGIRDLDFTGVKVSPVEDMDLTKAATPPFPTTPSASTRFPSKVSSPVAATTPHIGSPLTTRSNITHRATTPRPVGARTASPPQCERRSPIKDPQGGKTFQPNYGELENE